MKPVFFTLRIVLLVGLIALVTAQTMTAVSAPEIVEKRTETTKFFPGRDGQIRAEIYGSPVHYRDAAGKWQDIDTTVEDMTRLTDNDPNLKRFGMAAAAPALSRKGAMGLAEDVSGRLVPLKSQFDFAVVRNKFGFFASKNPLAPFAISLGEHEAIFFKPNQGQAYNGKAEKKGFGLKYLGVWKNASLRYAVSSTLLKEEIVLDSADAPSIYEFSLVANGLTPRLSKDNILEFVSSTGEIKATMLPPSARDAKGETIMLNVEAQIKGKSVDLKLGLDETWLRSAERQFPIMVDPSVLVQTSNADAFIDEYHNNECHGSTLPNELWVGVYRGIFVPESRDWALLKFDLTGLPKGAHVTQAELGMYCYEVNANRSGNSSALFNVHTVSFSNTWNEADVTWDSSAISLTQPSDPLAIPLPNTVGSWAKPVTTALIADLVANPGKSILMWTFDSDGYRRRFHSKDAAVDTTRKPHLSITYQTNRPPTVDVTQTPTEVKTVLNVDLAIDDPDFVYTGRLMNKVIFEFVESGVTRTKEFSNVSATGADWPFTIDLASWYQESTITWTVKVFDGSLWSQPTAPRTLVVDSRSPVINSLNPSFNKDTQELNVQWNATDGHMKEFVLTYSDGQNDQTFNLGSTMSQHTLTGAEIDKVYTIKLEARDQAGNMASKSTSFFTGVPITNVDLRFAAESTYAPAKTIFTAETNTGCSVASYKWDFDGNGNVDLETQENTTTYTYMQPGSYTPKVTVTDKAGNSLSDTAGSLTVNRLTFSVSLNAAPTSGVAPLVVSFAAAIDKPQVQPSMYEWDFNGDGVVDRTTVNGTAGYTYGTAGTYSPKVKVTDVVGTVAESSKTVTVEPTPSSPIAIAASAYPTEGVVPLDVVLRVSATSTAGAVHGFSWSFWRSSGGAPNSRYLDSPGTITQTFYDPGTYVVTLTVSDTAGNVARKTFTVNAIVPTETWQSSCLITPDKGGAPLNAGFYFSAPIPGASETRYEWDFDGDGSYDWASFATTLMQDAENGLGNWTAMGTWGITTEKIYKGNYSLSSGSAGNDLDNGLVSPDIDLRSVSDPYLELASTYWDATGALKPVIEVSMDGGQNWETLSVTFAPKIWWEKLRISLHNYGGSTIKIRFRTVASGSNAAPPAGTEFGQHDEWLIDDIVLSYSQSPTLVSPHKAADAGWTPDGTWALVKDPITNEDCWTDSPAGNYLPGADMGLATSEIDLTVQKQAFLVLNHRFLLDNDYVYVQVSTDGGATYTGFAYFTNSYPPNPADETWHEDIVSLTPYCGKKIRLRFRLKASLLHSGDDGWYIKSADIYASGYCQHQYTAPGSYTPKLRVTDENGNAYFWQGQVQVFAPGAPTVSAIPSVTKGIPPLAVDFQVSAVDNGSIVLYEWDFDGDEVYDWSATENGNASHTYAQAGLYQATVKVTDNDGNTSTATVTIKPDLTIELTPLTQSFKPLRGDHVPVQYTLNGAAKVSVQLLRLDGTPVRNLVVEQDRNAGSSTEDWDGKDDAGALVPQGIYLVVIRATLPDGRQYLLDLSSQFTSYTLLVDVPGSFAPFDGRFCKLSWYVSQPCVGSLYVAEPAYANSPRVRTLFTSRPMAVGNYSWLWDGTNDEGVSCVDGDFDFGLAVETLSPNAIIIEDDKPIFLAMGITPSYYNAQDNAYQVNPGRNKAAFNVTFDAPAKLVIVIRNDQGAVIRTLAVDEYLSMHTITWDGLDSDGDNLAPGKYFATVVGTSPAGINSEIMRIPFTIFY